MNFAIGVASTGLLAFFLSFVGALCVALPLAMVFNFLVSVKAGPIFMIGLTAIATGTIWTGQYFVGRLYMDRISRIGRKDFDGRKEALTPLFLGSSAVWIALALTLMASSGVNYGSLAIVFGMLFNLKGQRQKMIALRRALPNDDVPVRKIESTNGDFLDHLFALKSAENIEHLEQLSKQCLALIKPAATASSDCTSILINELMKRKLSTEADELSMLQLKLIEEQTN